MAAMVAPEFAPAIMAGTQGLGMVNGMVNGQPQMPMQMEEAPQAAPMPQ
jgi:hypothetical protein